MLLSVGCTVVAHGWSAVALSVFKGPSEMHHFRMKEQGPQLYAEAALIGTLLVGTYQGHTTQIS